MQSTSASESEPDIVRNWMSNLSTFLPPVEYNASSTSTVSSFLDTPTHGTTHRGVALDSQLPRQAIMPCIPGDDLMTPNYAIGSGRHRGLTCQDLPLDPALDFPLDLTLGMPPRPPSPAGEDGSTSQSTDILQDTLMSIISPHARTLRMPSSRGTRLPYTTDALFSNNNLMEGMTGDDDIDSALAAVANAERTKPADLRCWDHGCNGRVFTTLSNLRRHQRERSGKRACYLCPLCGAEFSRSTARNQHLLNRSCGRIRRYSNGRQRNSPASMMRRWADNR